MRYKMPLHVNLKVGDKVVRYSRNLGSKKLNPLSICTVIRVGKRDAVTDLVLGNVPYIFRVDTLPATPEELAKAEAYLKEQKERVERLRAERESQERLIANDPRTPYIARLSWELQDKEFLRKMTLEDLLVIDDTVASHRQK